MVDGNKQYMLSPQTSMRILNLHGNTMFAGLLGFLLRNLSKYSIMMGINFTDRKGKGIMKHEQRRVIGIVNGSYVGGRICDRAIPASAGRR